MTMPCSGSLTSRSDRALCLSTQGSASGEIFFFLFARCRIVCLKAITLNPSECLWASPLLDVIVTGACLCSPSGPVWDVWQVSADTVVLWVYFDLKKKNQPMQRDFSIRRYQFCPLPFFLIVQSKWPALSRTLSPDQEFQGYKMIWFDLKS